MYAEYGVSSNRCSRGQSYQVPQFQLIVFDSKTKFFFVQISPLWKEVWILTQVQVTEEHWVNSHGETTQPPAHMVSADRDEVSQ